MEERVQKLMAQANIGSRRACEEIINQGRVQVNGKTIAIGAKADPAKDHIVVDGERLRLEQRKLRYFVINKPKNMLSSTEKIAEDDRPIVREMIPVDDHLFTIGRLDADSEGLMILTNDGELANKLSHPRFEHTKTYKVTVLGVPSAEVLKKWEEGIWLDGSRTAPCHIRVVESNKKATVLRIVMIEGRKRQIRRLAAMLKFPVIRLVRTHIGQLGLGTLRKGGWYELGEEEVAAMQMPAEEVKFLRRRRRVVRVRDNDTYMPIHGEATTAVKRRILGVRPAPAAENASERKTSVRSDSERKPTARRSGDQQPIAIRPFRSSAMQRPTRRKSGDDDQPRSRSGDRPRSSGDQARGEGQRSGDRPRSSGGQSRTGDRPRSSGDGQRSSGGQSRTGGSRSSGGQSRTGGSRSGGGQSSGGQSRTGGSRSGGGQSSGGQSRTGGKRPSSGQSRTGGKRPSGSGSRPAPQRGKGKPKPR